MRNIEWQVKPDNYRENQFSIHGTGMLTLYGIKRDEIVKLRDAIDGALNDSEDAVSAGTFSSGSSDVSDIDDSHEAGEESGGSGE